MLLFREPDEAVCQSLALTTAICAPKILLHFHGLPPTSQQSWLLIDQILKIGSRLLYKVISVTKMY